MENKNEIIEFCKNNSTSQRELMEMFGFKHRPAVKKFLEENNITIIPFKKKELSKRISDARKAKRLEKWSKYNVDEIRNYCKNNNTSIRALVSLFGFSGRPSVQSFLAYHNITLNHYTQEEINNKIKNTHTNFTDDKKSIIAEKRKESMKKFHGVDFSLQSEEIKNKMKQNNFKKYGSENPFQVEEFKKKANDSMIEKYGVKYSFNREDVRDQCKNTCLDRYGVEYISQNKEEQLKNLIKAEKTLASHGKNGSLGEQEVREFVNALGFETEKKYIPLYNKDKWVKNFEIDIFVPSKNVGIEFNGEYWHSDQVLNDKYYHYKKSLTAEKNGYRLIHILETYWKQPNKRAIYESIIRNALGAPVVKLKAKKCEIRAITKKEAEEFFNANHLGGYISSKLAYGLFYKDELVQAELLSTPRFNRKVEWESTRGCSKLGYMIYGGYEKVLKYFKEEYDPKSIVSYVDFSVFRGALHEHAGFKFKSYTGPDHWYLDAENNLKRYWIVRGNKEVDLKWAADRDANIKYHYWFAGSKVYIWEKDTPGIDAVAVSDNADYTEPSDNRLF